MSRTDKRPEGSGNLLHWKVGDDLRQEQYRIFVGMFLDLQEGRQFQLIAEHEPDLAARLGRVTIRVTADEQREALLAPTPGPNGEPGVGEPEVMTLEALSALVQPAKQIFLDHYSA